MKINMYIFISHFVCGYIYLYMYIDICMHRYIDTCICNRTTLSLETFMEMMKLPVSMS